MPKPALLLVLGDLAAIAVVTLIGFATHEETGLALLPRMLSTFVPLVLSWFLAAPFLGLFKPQVTSKADQLWRPLVAMLLAGPLAALLRAVWLNTVVIPIFGLVLSASAGLGLLVWRTLWWFWQRPR